MRTWNTEKKIVFKHQKWIAALETEQEKKFTHFIVKWEFSENLVEQSAVYVSACIQFDFFFRKRRRRIRIFLVSHLNCVWSIVTMSSFYRYNVLIWKMKFEFQSKKKSKICHDFFILVFTGASMESAWNFGN